MNQIVHIPLFTIGEPTNVGSVYSMESVKQLKALIKEKEEPVKFFMSDKEVSGLQDVFKMNHIGIIKTIYTENDIAYAKVELTKIKIGLDTEAEVHEEIVNDEKVLIVEKIIKINGLNVIKRNN